MLSTENMGTYATPRHSTDSETSCQACRVCQCVQPDRRGDAALRILDIRPPHHEISAVDNNHKLDCLEDHEAAKSDIIIPKKTERESGVTEFISPTGERFICNIDLEAGSNHHHDKLINLGCSCKSDLALAHYACALKWFVNRGSIVCEICETVAKNVRSSDFDKIATSLENYEKLMEKTVSGEPTSVLAQTGSGVDPDAVAGIRRQRLSEIALWFNIHVNNNNNSSSNNSTTISNPGAEHTSSNRADHGISGESFTNKWAVEITAFLLATGLLSLSLAWEVAPHVGKRTAKIGLLILLGGICTLTIVIFLRFLLPTRVKYGPARFWWILFVLWFLVFGIWASRTHGAHKK